MTDRLTEFTEVAEVVRAVLARPARLGAVRLVAVDGRSGAGKSTVAAALVDRLRDGGTSTALVPTDHFATWADPVSWWPRLVDGVLTPLAAGRAGRYRATAWRGGQPEPGDWVDVAVPAVLVVEGVSAGRRSVRPLLTGLVYVTGGDRAQRLARAVARDGAEQRSALLRWQEFERGWFAVDDPRGEADWVIHGNGT